ncbi:MAG: beta-galactosidase [Bacteroidales bacterium]|nr:beta-galactosidase [Bacteroidales bacterium]
MKTSRIIVAAILLGAASLSLSAWSPKGDKIKTRWAADVTPETAWQSYPRPQLVRTDWQNLNGLWKLAISDRNADAKNISYDREILVPYCIESSLSGVMESFTPEQKFWYSREFTLAPSWKGKNIILHFGAVDYACEVYVNGKFVGSHVGGNNSFSLDITKAVKTKGANTLEVRGTDPTDTGTVTRGKQQLNPKGIWYTPVSGIWKTVWMEPVSALSIKSVVPTTAISGKVSFDITLSGKATGKELVEIEVLDGGKKIAGYEGPVSGAALTVEQPELWSPDSPKLYRTVLTLKSAGKVLDKAESYFAIREISTVIDQMGNTRFALNGDILFQWGPLDQGWWPDGLLTPPSEEAMIYDMIQLKKMGFNTIRKHIKVEPELYYHYADSLGLMIWQDMPSGFQTAKAGEQHVGAYAAHDWDAPAEHEEQWKFEYEEMVNNLKFFPSITTWVVFNEGWGQFRTAKTAEFAYGLANGRIINAVTGWTDRKVGDIYDIHNYPSTAMKLVDECGGRMSVLGEFGGLGLPVEGHTWQETNGWGYKNMAASLDLLNNYSRLCYDLEALIAQGLCAAIYTQTTDVEIELNGFMTYDREVCKLNEQNLHMLHSRLYNVEPTMFKYLVKRSPEKKIARIAPRQSVVYKENFNFDGSTENLSIWLESGTNAVIKINGKEIFNGAIRQTRSYNHYNISDYVKYLRKGENTIEFSLTNEAPKKAASFDFALTTF